MLRSRLFMLMLATLLIAQSALGAVSHRCHEGSPQAADNAVATAMLAAANSDNGSMPCHSHADTDANSSSATATNIDSSHHVAAPHGMCTCAIAHCAPGIISQFELVSAPTYPTTMPLYRFVVLTAPAETLLRPPIVLS